MKQLDMLVVSLPVLDLQYPPSSPAVIKACVNAAGYTARTADLNHLLLTTCGSKDKFWQIQYHFENAYYNPEEPGADPVVNFFRKEHNIIRNWLDASIAIIQKHNPVWLGISVFSYKSHKACLVLVAEMQRLGMPTKILLGGRGASSFALGPDHPKFKAGIQKIWGKYPYLNFGETLLHYGLVHSVIQGDGENAVVELLNNTAQSNIVAHVDDIDLQAVPFVDYDDYDLTAYDYVNEPTIAVTGSKGCVRQCTFCDIPVLWPRFKYRSGTHIAQEMIHLYQRYGVRKFYMTDSLVNGSMRAFLDFTNTLAKHNSSNPEASIKWVGQYITRPRSAVLNDQYYALLKQSGGEGLTIGVESGSDAVRAHMKKQFTTADIDHELSQFQAHQLVCVLLFFSCYPTETLVDFELTVQMLIRYQQYCASGTVYKITLGTPYTHHAQTPLWNQQETIGLNVRENSDILWRLGSNPELTFHERVRRRLVLQEVCVALKLPMSRNTAELNQLIDTLTNYSTEIEDYFGAQLPMPLYVDTHSLTGQEHVLMPPDIQTLVAKHLTDNPSFVDRILAQHHTIQDDIVFENDSYLKLRSLVCGTL